MHVFPAHAGMSPQGSGGPPAPLVFPAHAGMSPLDAVTR